VRPSCAGKASLIEPLGLWSRLDRTACVERAHELATLVGLDPNRHLARYPHQLTSGEQQRVTIARGRAQSEADRPRRSIPTPRAAIIKLLLKLQRESRLHLSVHLP
jgi:ABC-type proline/glycine betaine transport system ATPase subunit